MREERKLEKMIQRDGERTQSDILDELKRRYPQYTKRTGKKQSAVKKRRVAVLSTFAAVAACLAIILPCSLLLPNKQPTGGGSNIYYCSFEEYEKSLSESTLREYSKNNDYSILFFDWYNTAEELLTNNFVRITDKQVLCVQELAYNPVTDEILMISVTKANVYLDEFDTLIDTCKNEHTVLTKTVKWYVADDGAYCIFEHNGYRYFIKIEAGQDENRLFALVEELLVKNIYLGKFVDFCRIYVLEGGSDSPFWAVPSGAEYTNECHSKDERERSLRFWNV